MDFPNSKGIFAYSNTMKQGQAEEMMGLQTGLPLLIQQYKALLKKNYLLSMRNKQATFLQLFSSFFFILLMFCIDQAITLNVNSSEAYTDLTDPKRQILPPIPPCEDMFYVKEPCFDFIYSGQGSHRVESIVSKIMANNPGRPIPPNKVKSFGTPGQVDEWLFDNPWHCPGALHFAEKKATVMSYGIQTNSTPVAWRGRKEDPTFKFQVPLQIAAEREIARNVIGDPNFPWVVAIKKYPHPAKPKQSATEVLGSTFFLAIAIFNFVFQIGYLVTEKELKLRQAMTMMGLYETSYWLSWFTWEVLSSLFSSLFTVLFGIMFRFRFFVRNSFAIVFLLFFLFQINMVGFAFLLSTFISKASSATSAGFSIFIIGFMTQLITSAGWPYNSMTPETYWKLWSLFPPNLLAKGLDVLMKATSEEKDKGIRWGKRNECPNKNAVGCVIDMDFIYQWLALTFFLWILLTLYFDNVFPNANGVRKPLHYFLKPYYWTGTGGNKAEEGGIFSCFGSIPPIEDGIPDDEDVREEEDVVKKQVEEGIVDPQVAVQLRGLVKTYPGTFKIDCCKFEKTSPYHAVRGLWLNLAKDQLFCLLGHNGAGKSTAISCLTGISPVTSGDAMIYGYSVRSSVDMSNIRRLIGVCPQFDILWNTLSGKEHLHLFANIKGLHPSLINRVTDNLLAEVKLAGSAKIRSGSYSGGMKRRLSVAIALIGDPKFVVLDEPTTGMDPITRRHVWDIIENAKKGRSILLTTHSMEEADILSDRIAIIGKGKLQCIGTSIKLKSRFGTGFMANVSFPVDVATKDDTHHQAVKRFFKMHLDVAPQEENKAFLTFVIPQSKERLLTNFFSELQDTLHQIDTFLLGELLHFKSDTVLEGVTKMPIWCSDRQKEFGISDIQLGLTTLEEVFLNVAKRAEFEVPAPTEE